MPGLNRNLEKEVFYINRWMTGLYTERSPLFVPLSSMGLQIITRFDTLWDGHDVDISPEMTLRRRPGFPKYCSNAFEEAERPQAFFSYKNTSGTITAMVDTPIRVASFDQTGITTVFEKIATFTIAPVGASFYGDAEGAVWPDELPAGDYYAQVVALDADDQPIAISNEIGPFNPNISPGTCGSMPSGWRCFYAICFPPENGTDAVPEVATYRVYFGKNGPGGEDQVATIPGDQGSAIVLQLVASAGVPTELLTGVTTQTSFEKVGDHLFMCNGNFRKIWDGTTISDWGVIPPTTTATLSLGAGALTAKAGYSYVYAFRRSSTGEISSATQPSANTGAFTSQQVTVGGEVSLDTLVDKIEIYRNRDGGSVYYFLAEVDNGTEAWTYTDALGDSSLNDDIVAPLAHINDPPPTGIHLCRFHMGRMWVAESNHLYFGGGPQITTGVPESCFPPANEFTLPGKITALVSTSVGMGVFTADDFYIVFGTDISNFYIQKQQANFGVNSQNCIAQDGDLLFVFTSKAQLFQFSSSLTEIGFSIRKLLAGFDPASTYLALHRSGSDEGLFISNGTTDMYRYSVSMNCWSTVYHPVGGVRCISSLEVATADYRLALGRASTADYIFSRSLTSFQDDSTSYSASATIGSLMLAAPGKVATVESVMVECMPVGTYPTVSILLQEISGTFVPLPNPVPDPPNLPFTTTIWSKRHYLRAAQTPLPQQVRHAMVKVEFAAEAAANELLGLAIQ